MKQQVFVIHGGTTFAEYDAYISYLKSKEVALEKLKAKDWKANLEAELGDGFEVYLVKMPNAQNARYFDWALWFEKYIPLLQDGVIFIGHSLGAVFLAKYMAENDVKKKIKATFLVAAPHDEDEGRPMPEFSITTSLKKLASQAGTLYMYHSKDDPVVAYNELEKYRKELPEAVCNVFEDKLHFNQESFPEIVQDIKKAALYSF